MTYSFLDDYSEGAHPNILNALAKSNDLQQSPYGEDSFSIEGKKRILRHLGSEFKGDIHFVASGTMANIIAISSCLRPHEAVIAVDSGHIVVREAGAIEATGHKLIVVPAENGKLTPENIESALSNNAHFPHMAKPKLIYLSNATETGTIYSKIELELISELAKQHNLILFMDGARLGSALAAEKNDLSMADITSLVDLFWIGGTKVGALLGEAIVICNPALTKDFAFHIKQRGGMLAKGRLLGIQFQELFNEDDCFFTIARHANMLASKIASGIVSNGYVLDAETETNQVFPVLPNTLISSLQDEFSFYIWRQVDEHNSVIRLVTSWATEVEQVDKFVSRIASYSV